MSRPSASVAVGLPYEDHEGEHELELARVGAGAAVLAASLRQLMAAEGPPGPTAGVRGACTDS